MTPRRTFLAGLASAIGIVASWKFFGRNFGGDASQTGATANSAAQTFAALPSVKTPLRPFPSDPAQTVSGLSPLVTPTADFFRIDTAIGVDAPEISNWTLEISGMVDNPMTLTYDQLIARDLIEVDATIACVSNVVGGSLVGNARWIGVRLDDLIAECRPHADADQIMGWSVDNFSAGFPVAALDGRDAIVAVGMNGEALTPSHGFPARLIVPGLFGYVSATKWLSKIELTRFDIKQGFWISRGWSQDGPMKMESRIDTPHQGATIKAGALTIAGVAWAPLNTVSRIEIKVDGDGWKSATLGPILADTTWRQWWLDVTLSPGLHTVMVRAYDHAGTMQTETVKDIEPDGATGWHSVVVTVDA